jgi:cell fate regulator YaaT (PSP1 superfamily)
MSGEPPKEGSAKKPGRSRRRRRRKRPAQKGGAGSAAPSTPTKQGQAAGAERPEGAAAQGPRSPAATRGQPASRQDGEGGKPRSRRPRRRPKKRADGPQQQQQKAEGGKSRRRRRRRRKPAGEAPERERERERERAPAEAAKLDEAVDDESQESLAFPDEESWDPGEAEPPAPPPPRTTLPELIDADDLVMELEQDLDAPLPEGELHNVALVRFRDRAAVHAYETGELNLDGNERVVVETEQGHVVGSVARRSQRTLVQRQLPRLLRRIDHNDMRQEARNAFREREAFEFCRERIAARSLPMKLIRVEYLHGGNKAIFFFAAEHRVDFRELVKDLAQRFHTRIVMRQVGVRDEAKMTGGIGSCGMPLCCAGWLPKFEPVSIRMAKDQNLVLNPQKVSGQCGRLKCCLTYEQALYQEARRNLPKTGRTVRTPDGDGRVQEIDILRGIVRVSLPDGKVQTYPADQVEPIAKPPAKQ